MRFKNGLKAQKHLAQGIALGIMAISKAPCKGKSFIIPASLIPEHEIFIIFHIIYFQERSIFLCKRMLGVMLFLIGNVL